MAARTSTVVLALALAALTSPATGLKLFALNSTADVPHDEKLRLADEVCKAKKAVLELKNCKPDIAKAKEELAAIQGKLHAGEDEELIDKECAAKKKVLKKEECLPKLKAAEANLEEAEKNLYNAEHYLLAAVPQEHRKLIDEMCNGKTEDRTQFFAVQQKEAPLEEQTQAVNAVCSAEKKVLSLADCEPSIDRAEQDLAAVQAKSAAQGPSEALIDEECAAKKKVMQRKECLPKLAKAKEELAEAERNLSVAQHGYLLFSMPKCVF